MIITVFVTFILLYSAMICLNYLFILCPSGDSLRLWMDPMDVVTADQGSKLRRTTVRQNDTNPRTIHLISGVVGQILLCKEKRESSSELLKANNDTLFYSLKDAYRIRHGRVEGCPPVGHSQRRQREPPRAPRTRARSNGTPRLRPPWCRARPRANAPAPLHALTHTLQEHAHACNTHTYDITIRDYTLSKTHFLKLFSGADNEHSKFD